MQVLVVASIALVTQSCRGLEERPRHAVTPSSPAASASTTALEAFEAETLRQRITAVDGRSWDAAFDVAFDGAAVFVTLRVKLVPGPGVTRAAIREREGGWREAAAGAWSRRLWVETPGGQRSPVLFALSFGGAETHHDVIVRQGSGRSSPLHWNLYDPPQRVAHEIGHLLGAYDEYPAGALAPSLSDHGDHESRSARPAGASMMGVEGAALQGAEPRHMYVLGDWLRQRTGVALRLVKDTP